METNQNTTETPNETNQEQPKQPTKTELLRELSEDWGINAFDPNQVKAKFNQLKEYEDSQKSELEKLQEQANNYKTQYETNKTKWETEKQEYDIKLASIKIGIKEESLNDAIVLSNNYEGTTEEKLKKVIEKYPSFATGTQQQDIAIGVQQNNQQPKGISEQEAYLQRMRKDPKYARYIK